MYCAQCGKQIDEDSRFCRHCGAKQLPDEPRHETPRPDRFKVIDLARTDEGPRPPLAKRRVGTGWLIAGGVLFLFVVIGLFGGGNPLPPAGNKSAVSADAAADNIDAAANEMDDAASNMIASTPTVAVENWSYRTDEDKVRGGTSYYATVTSTNTIRQAPPYDSDTSMSMMVRKHPAYGTDVVLTISSGQMMCPSYEGCSGTVRFDDGPAQRVRFSGPEDNSSNTIFVDGAKSFIAKLKRAKKVIIEKTLYEAGNPQFEFDVAGLKWDH